MFQFRQIPLGTIQRNKLTTGGRDYPANCGQVLIVMPSPEETLIPPGRTGHRKAN